AGYSIAEGQYLAAVDREEIVREFEIAVAETCAKLVELAHQARRRLETVPPPEERRRRAERAGKGTAAARLDRKRLEGVADDRVMRIVDSRQHVQIVDERHPGIDDQRAVATKRGAGDVAEVALGCAIQNCRKRVLRLVAHHDVETVERNE